MSNPPRFVPAKTIVRVGSKARQLVCGSLSILAFLASLQAANTAVVQSPSRVEFRTVVQMFGYFHPRRAAVTEQELPRILELFLARLDAERAYFTKGDVGQLTAKYGPDIAVKITYIGDFSTAFSAYDVYQQRNVARNAWISERLKQWKEFARADLVPPVPHPAWLPASDLDLFWEQRLRSEWALEVARGASEAGAAELLRLRYETALRSSMRTPDDIAALFVNSFAALFDPDSTYFSAGQMKIFSTSQTGQDVGIAASLSTLGRSSVFMSVTPEGPADLAGIMPGDRLLAVESADGQRIDTMGLDLQGVTKLLSGPAGSAITLVIERPYSLSSDSLTLIRNRAPEQRAHAFLSAEFQAEDRKRALGVVAIPSLYGSRSEPSGNEIPAVSADVQTALAAFDAAGVEGIVLDLRGNGGGLLLEGVQVAGLFVGNEVIARESEIAGKVRVDRAEHIASVYRRPLVVLVDEGTGSGAELIAGALQDYGRAVVVGTNHTAGTASIAAVLELKNYMPKTQDLSNLGAVRLAVGHFYLPRGTSPEPDGLMPDLLLSTPTFSPAPAHTAPPRPPLASIAPLVNAGDPDRAWLLSLLKQKSESRQAKLPELRYLQRWVQELSQTPTNRPGNPAELRQWIQARSAAMERFKTEGNEFTANAPRFQPVPLHNPITAAAESTAHPAGDLVLREALRILADTIELQTTPRPPPS